MNAFPRNLAYKTISMLVVLAMVLSMIPAGGSTSAAPTYPSFPVPYFTLPTSYSSSSTGLYRAHITLRQPADRARLDSLGITVLETAADDPPYGRPTTYPATVLVLVDEDQLETLARLRFEPRASNELGALVEASASEKPWLATGLRPLLSQAAAAHEQLVVVKAKVPQTLGAYAKAQAALRTVAHSLTTEQLAGITALPGVDSDGDGLTDTEEQWWCTDPLNANSDGDAQGYTDGQEVDALLDFTLSRTVRWNYGPPFGPPNAWPDFNGQDGDPSTSACNDGDYDTIPDYAEIFMVGSRVPEESTDRQPLFYVLLEPWEWLEELQYLMQDGTR